MTKNGILPFTSATDASEEEFESVNVIDGSDDANL